MPATPAQSGYRDFTWRLEAPDVLRRRTGLESAPGIMRRPVRPAHGRYQLLQFVRTLSSRYAVTGRHMFASRNVSCLRPAVPTALGLRFPLGIGHPESRQWSGKDVLVPRPSKYPEQFRRDAVELVRSSGRSLREVGKELGVNHETLRNWVTAAKRAEAGQRAGAESISADEREELRRLRKKVAELELEKEILRKAAQYFAKETGR